ncbi:hypothetical protein [Kribbella sp. C-35]|uniref:hypothetical protein n=1 Tax=Kribbella sp. C-35 TaxID=2789276 RepID=UPI00397D7174
MLPTLRSLPAPDALATELGTRYNLTFTSCTLLRSLVNDVYQPAVDRTKSVGRQGFRSICAHPAYSLHRSSH